MKNQKGQILLITIMLIATILTVVLAVTFKSTTETQLTKLEEESQKALSAAEAGVELALQRGGIDEIGNLPEFLDTGITGNASTNSKLDTKFVSPLLKKDQQYTFYLADYPNFAQKYRGSIALYFQSEPDTCPSVASVEMTFLGSEPADESSPLPPPPTQTPTPGAATATPTPALPGGCVTAHYTWKNESLGRDQKGTFTSEFDVKPKSLNISSGDIGFSEGDASGTASLNNLVAIIRFNAGKIKLYDQLNGGFVNPQYNNGLAYLYTPNVNYHFRMEVNVATGRYDVNVKPEGSAEILLSSNLGFKNSVAKLNNKAIHLASLGPSQNTMDVCNFQISGAAEPPTPTPTPGSSSPIEIVSRNIIDPCNHISNSEEGIGFTPAPPEGYFLGGYSFGYKSDAISVSNQVVLVVRSLFYSTRIGIESLNGQDLPVQGKYVTSEAKTPSGVTKKVELFQSYPQIPAEFFVTSF